MLGDNYTVNDEQNLPLLFYNHHHLGFIVLVLLL